MATKILIPGVVNPPKAPAPTQAIAAPSVLPKGVTGSGVLKPGTTNIPGLATVQKAPAPVAQAQPSPGMVQALLAGTGSGSGSASGAGGAVSPAAAAPSLQDYINSNFLYQQQQGQNADALSNYDAGTLAQTQETQAQQALKEQQLGQQQNQLGQTNADNLAAHGLLDSGVNFQNQDKINANGVNQQSAIDSLLTNLVSSRQQGRLGQQQANQTALNTLMNQLTQQYAGTQSAAI